MTFLIQKLDRRHAGSQAYQYRAERVYERTPTHTGSSIKAFVEARQYLWQAFGGSADLSELYASYGSNNYPVWCWRSHYKSGDHLYFKSQQELSVFLLKYASITQVDPKIKF